MKLRRFATFFLLFLLVLAAAAGVGIHYLLITPYKTYTERLLPITIAPGTSVNAIAQILYRKGVIIHPWVLKGLFIFNKTQGQSKAGDYVFDRALSPLQVYDKLLKGETHYSVLTIVEGSNIFDVERVLVTKNVGKQDEVRNALHSAQTIQALHGIDAGLNDPEGFLFPETYFLAKWEDAQKAVVLMLRQFNKHYGIPEKDRAKALGMTTLQIVTLASLIEKETAQSYERPLISSVFHNRLKKSMLLQCDPTVIYALILDGKYRGTIYRSDLQHPSLYNTYITAGLPPGPICNPGRASILAALYPQESEMLYFVAKNDGTHQFSSTLQEHNRAVQKYQRNH
jgi:UPF0755 protein